MYKSQFISIMGGRKINYLEMKKKIHPYMYVLTIVFGAYIQPSVQRGDRL